MMSKKWGSYPSIVTIVVLAGLVGAIAPGYTSFATPSVQQGKNNPSINTPSGTVNTQNEEVQANTENSPNAPDRFGLQEGMPYKKAREVLIQKGWQPHLLGDAPNLNDTSVRELFDLGYQEVKDCSGTGLGPCRFEFTNAAGELLAVSAITAGASNRERQVWRWFIEKRTDNQQSSLSPDATQNLPFVGTRFFNFIGGNGTGQSITIQADGTTIIKSHGTVSSSVEYRGKFSNRIRLENGFGLILNDDKIYSLSPNGQIGKGCKGEGTLCESDLYQPPIAEGLYIIGGTDQGLEVKGKQYRYYDEGGEKEWRRISELSYVSDGVVFDGKNYWCISPRTEAGVCSENGWTPVR
ncbi:hypothetical protein [Microseira sp. BLCC-F43]|jgi:hypothetical protein|uniref:hypothetical protein n=1 Tax=Microseira sp. BLCC-F43 TaxID=3153602 RepID=UPI0035BA2C2E